MNLLKFTSHFKTLDLSERFLTDNDAYETFKKIASRNQPLNKYGSCHSLESPQQCKNRIICKLRSTFSSNGAFSSHELCKKQQQGYFYITQFS